MALSNSLKEDASGNIFVNNNDGAGTALTSTLNVAKQSLDVNVSNTSIAVTGTVTATNPSVGTTGSTAPTSATLAGGIAATTGATITAGNLADLSLTLASALRVDASATTQPISAASLPLPTGAATSANQATEIASLASIDAGIPAALGSALTAASMPVNIASDQVVPISATALPLPSGAATSALQTSGNASLTAIAASVAGPTPAGTNSIGSVVIPFLSPTTSTPTQPSLSTSSSSVLSLNTARKSYMVTNNSISATCFVSETGTATLTNWAYKIAPGGYYESPCQCYTGAISMISSAAVGNLQVVERS